MKFVMRTLCFAAATVAAFGQATPAPALNFEVASIRAAGQKPPYTPIPAAGVINGGPGTTDPTRMTYTWVLVRRLLMEAFKMPLDQLSGNDWVMGQDARFDITANVPAPATKEQANEMLLNLLTERFHLKYHREKKDFDMWTLTVAKGGAEDSGPLKCQAGRRPKTAPSRVTRAGGGATGSRRISSTAGRTTQRAREGRHERRDVLPGVSGCRLPQSLLGMLQFPARRDAPIDKTGLTGQYDFTLEFAQTGLPGIMGRGGAGPDAASDPAPDFILNAQQLGLKLEKSKVPLDVIVIDHMDKEPTEN